MSQMLMIYYELENSADRLKKIREILERCSLECKHFSNNLSFIKSEVGPADLDWIKFEFLYGTECLLISKLVSNAGFGRTPQSEIFNWVSQHNDQEYNDLISEAIYIKMKKMHLGAESWQK